MSAPDPACPDYPDECVHPWAHARTYAEVKATQPALTTPPTTLADLVDDHGNLPDPCGHCTLVPVADGWHRVRQARCPHHGMPPPPVAPTGVDDVPLPGLDTTGGAK